MPNDTHPLKQAVIDLGTWVDRWRDEPGLKQRCRTHGKE
jgi:hypothetical protein